MVVVAVAGGTGKIGRTIAEGIVATRKHEVLICQERKSNNALEQELGVHVVAVDYADVQAVPLILEENHVDTIVSAISMMPGPSGEEPKEIVLVPAADLSKTTKRMISSDWGIPHSPEHAKKLGSVFNKHKAQAELKNAQNLETTYVKTGWFMDFWGVPGVKSCFDSFAMCVDIPNETAALPGDGNMPVVMTHSSDIAKFVAASLDLENWDTVLYTVGDKVSMNVLLHFAEKARGKRVSVTYDSLEMLRAGSTTELPGHIQGYSLLPKKVFQSLKTLNDDFPEIKTLKVKDMVNQAWKNI